MILAAVLALLLFPPKTMSPTTDAEAASQAPFSRAQSIESQVIALESKVWKRGEDLTPEDFNVLRAHLGRLQECHEDLLRIVDSGSNSGNAADLQAQRMLVEVWILDLKGLTAPTEDPLGYGGIAIPYHRADSLRESLERASLTFLRDMASLPARNNPEEKETIRKRLEEYDSSLSGCLVEYERLWNLIRRDISPSPHLRVPDFVRGDGIDLGDFLDLAAAHARNLQQFLRNERIQLPD